MDLRKIKKLIELLEDSALAEMEITEGDNTIRLARAEARHAHPPVAPAPVASVTPTPVAPVANDGMEAAQESKDESGTVIKSPLVGTFYASPSPDADPYVRVGQTVAVGDTLCVIEAMKTFNQLDADVAGRVSAIHKQNGEPVEFGEPLFVIVPNEQ